MAIKSVDRDGSSASQWVRQPTASPFAGIERIRLAHLPTPIDRLDGLAAALDMEPGRLLVKRDDATGLAGGGNKARKLEYLTADALSRGCDWLVSGGGPQSNHARMTAAAACRLGMGCTLILDGSPVAEPSGNLVLDKILGAEILWSAELGHESLEDAIAAQVVLLEQRGRRPYHVTVGGSTPLGALGYAQAALEISDQVGEIGLVVVATGSAGTHAGLVAGFGRHQQVVGVRVGTREQLQERVERLAAETAELAGLPRPQGSCRLLETQLGEGYAKPTAAGAEAILLAARCDGLILDPVYTGKAMAGLIELRRTGVIEADTTVVFMHTGGMPGLLATEHSRWITERA